MNELPIEAVLLILTVWSVLALICMGVGFLTMRCFGLRIHVADDYFKSFWIGWSSIIFLLQIWHIFFRVDWKALVLVLTIGVAGIVLHYGGLRSSLRGKTFRNPIFWAILFLVFLVLANRAILPTENFNTGLYHLASVKWTATYSLIPGLGNLHGRLAFNNSYFLYAALLEIVNNESHHLANGILLLMFFAQSLFGFLRLLQRDTRHRIYHVYIALFLIPIIREIFSVSISSASPQLSVLIVGALISAQLLKMIKDTTGNYKSLESGLFYIVVLGICGITIKLSFLVMGISSLLVAVGVWLFRSKKQKQLTIVRVLIIIILCASIGLIPMMIRSVILSGYLMYPSTLGAYNVDWRIPYASVINMNNWIRSWARAPGVHWSESLGNWDWLLPWLKETLKILRVIIPLALVSIGFIVLLFRRLRQKYRHGPFIGLVWLFFLPAVLSLLYWFFTAPDVRFIGAALWIFGIGVFSMAIEGLPNLRKAFGLFYSLCIIFLLSSFVGGKLEFLKTLIREKNMPKTIKELNNPVFKRGQDRFGFHSTTCTDIKTFKTDSGLKLYYPADGDQCWDAPLPCTPYPRPDLRLRRKDDMRSGFIIYPRNESDPNVGIHR
ncbi:LIC_10190 family membrane protein [Acidobacteriota bacterium]